MNTDQVKKLAHLARLSASDAELEKIASDMGSILGFVDEIQNVEITDRETRDLARVNVFREDIVAPIEAAHDLVELAPLHKDHFVQVPKVIGE
jgi:aspartyl-tRNA(Asn)/glutamyl-tRNA(Gln) amidotransferase subunit C